VRQNEDYRRHQEVFGLVDHPVEGEGVYRRPSEIMHFTFVLEVGGGGVVEGEDLR
jgi:hypothetical protein